MMNRISFMFGLLFATFCFATDGNMAGDGTVDNPWQVADYEDLKAVGVGSYSMNGHYVLVADIDASASRGEKNDTDSTGGFQPIGVAYYGTPQSSFGGVFDGANHTISHLYSISKESRSTAMFMGIDSTGVVKNLKMEDCFFSAEAVWAAAAVAVVNSGRIENIEFVRDTVIGTTNTGGVAGVNEGGIVQNIDFDGVVRGINDRIYIGGVVGSNSGANSVIRNVKVHADLVTNYYGRYLGAIAGINEGLIVSAEAEGLLEHGVRFLGGVTGSNLGTIDSCVSHVSVVSLNESAGGLAGYNSGTIKNSSVVADSVISHFGVAGFVATNDTTGVIENCSAKTSVKADSSAGFVVYNAGVIKNSHAEGFVIADTSSEGFGYNVSGFVVYNVGTVLNSYSESKVEGLLNVGGFVLNNIGTISNSYSKSNVDGVSMVGGFAGRNSGKIDNCYATGILNKDKPGGGGEFFGGFIATNDSNGIITNSYATGEVRGQVHSGGFVDINNGKIHNCYATGDIHAYAWFAGFVAKNQGEILYSYATGNVEKLESFGGSLNAGGFVGLNEGYIDNAYATGNVISEYTPGGFVSTNEGIIKNAFASGTVSGLVQPGGFVSTNTQDIENVFFAGKSFIAEENPDRGTNLLLPSGFVSVNSGSVKNAFYNEDDCGLGPDSTVSGIAFAEMKNPDTYKNWADFDKYWVLSDSMPFAQLTFTAGVVLDSVEAEPPAKIVKQNVVAFKGTDGLKLYGSRQNLRATITLTRSGMTRVKVYNLKGRLQKTVSLGMMGEGVHHVELNGAVESRGVVVMVLEQNGRALSKSLLR